jgi:hypothetical protein
MLVMAIIPTDKHERLAVACVSGIVGRFNGGGIDQVAALVEIAGEMRNWKIPAERVPFVLSSQLRHWLRERYYSVGARALLLAAGADLELAERMRVEDPTSSGPRTR